MRILDGKSQHDLFDKIQAVMRFCRELCSF